MSRLSMKIPISPNLVHQKETISTEINGSDIQGLSSVCLKHYFQWSNQVYEFIVCVGSEGTLNLPITGGSDNGEFAYFGSLVQDRINYLSGRAEENDIILEIQGQKVAGYTQRDIVAWLNHCCRNGSPVTIRAVKAGSITTDLRQFLNTRFQKGSLDHDLQNTIRDNLYLRTVPCTTRSARDGEVNGVDYTFLTIEEFKALEKSGNLLESGIYEGNHYGTPKPPKESPLSPPHRTNFDRNGSSIILPGAHPSSEGKRRRNRSNVEAMASKSVDPLDSSAYPLLSQTSTSRSSTPTSRRMRKSSGDVRNDNSLLSNFVELGPLPDNWEKAYTETGECYFIDHNTGSSQWLDPRLARVQKRSVEDCEVDELPYGWERIDDPHYGTYYIDHVNRRTQYENPVLQARRGGHPDGPSQKPHRTNFFTRNPNELQGEMIHTSLLKSSRGFGFTIVGGDDGSVEEFLQIKSVVPDGPAWLDGKLQTGDVLVYVNKTCVLGYSHQDVVQLFQSISPGETVNLEVCRGYMLPFDPEDPSNEIVTTVAVAVEEDRPSDTVGNDGSDNPSQSGGDVVETLGRAAKSMPDLSDRQQDHLKPHRHNSADLLSPSVSESTPDILDFNPHSSSKPEYLTVEIVKGTSGFGFTIADSSYGQKVKKILDRPRCKLLQEGDILVEINHHDVKGLSHSEVVQVLKDCPCGSSAVITLQRGGLLSPSRGKLKSNKGKLLDMNRKSNSSSSFFFSNVPQSTGYLPPVKGAYRSKTPTADLYSSREREVVTVNRPKTPLVDTRNWSKSVDVNRPKSSSKLPLTNSLQGRSFSALDSFLASGNGELPPKHATSLNEDETFRLNDGHWFDHGKGAKDSQWTNRSFRETRVTPQKEIYHYVRRSSEQSSDAKAIFEKDKENHSKTTDGFSNGSCSVDESNYLQSHYFPERPTKSASNASSHHYNRNWTQMPETSHRDFESQTVTNLHKMHTSNGPIYTSYYEPTSNGTYSIMGGYGTIVPPTTNHVSRQDSSMGYYTSAEMSPHASNASHQSFGGSQYDSLTRRKHSTSFEHEQPITSTTTQYSGSRDFSGYLQYGNYRMPPSPANRVADSLDMTITLHRQENGFGFRIVGGTEEGSQVSIGHIVPGGAANLDARLQSGDAIVTVDGHTVLNTSHHHVVQLMGNAAANGRVTLGIRRKLVSFDSFPSSKSNESIYPYEIIVTRRENEGFGFVIISSINRSGSTIGRIIEGSPAERCGQLHVGDRILAVNGVSILNMHHGEIVNLIKESGFSVTLTIGPPQDDGSSTTSVSQRGDEHSLEQEEVYFAVELLRGARGFGFSIRGGREFQNMPLFVLRIAEHGPAHQDGRLQVGDQIIEINGTNTKNMTHADAIEIIKQGGNSVRLLVKRGSRLPLAFVDHPSPITPTGSVGTPLSAVSSMLNGPICQSSPRDIPTYELSRDVWNYDPH